MCMLKTLILGIYYYINMRNGKFTHLETNEKIRTDWYNRLFRNSLSKMIYQNQIVAKFLDSIQYMLSYAIHTIKKIETYYRP